MRRKNGMIKGLAVLLCALLALALFSACTGGAGGKANTTERSTREPTTLPPAPELKVETFKFADYEARANAAAPNTNKSDLSGMYAGADYAYWSAGDLWDRSIGDLSLKNQMNGCMKTIYEDKDRNMFLVVGVPIPGENARDMTCYLLIEKSDPPRVYAAWAEESAG